MVISAHVHRYWTEQIQGVGSFVSTGRTDFDDEVARCLQDMHPLTHQLAVKRASLDGEARIVAHAGSLSIVNAAGETWHVFDAEGPTGELRACPLNDERIWARVFINADGEARRIYRFGLTESRSTAPLALLGQLERAKAGDARAA